MSSKRKRGLNYSAEEKLSLINICNKYKDIIGNRKTNEVSRKQREDTWHQICLEFNANSGIHRDMESLQKLFKKQQTKRNALSLNQPEASTIGGGSNNVSEDQNLSLEETSSSDINEHLTMLKKFRSTDLQTLLGTFGCSKSGRKFELLQRATDLLMDTSIKFPGFCRQAYLDKIIMINYSLHNMNNQQPRMSHLQQYIQQPITGTQAGLSQAGLDSLLVNSNTENSSYQHFGFDNVVSTRPTNQPLLEIPSLSTTSSGNDNSFIISAQYLANIKFKKLQFYEVQSVVLKPSVLIGEEIICSLQKKDLMKKTYTFVLKIEEVNNMSLNRNMFIRQKDYVYQTQIRIGQLEATTTEINDYLPLDLCIEVNGETCTLPSPIPNNRPGAAIRRIPRPIDCSKMIKLTPNRSNNITINWVSDEKKYVLAVFVVKKLTSDGLFKKLLAKEARNLDKTKNDIINKLINVDPDLATTSYRFSLICPLSKKRMNIPANSSRCHHLQCFDAMSYILMNEKKPTWECPTCQKPCLYDDIQIESYFWEVLKDPALTDSCKEIELLADGTWKMYEETKTTENLKSTYDIDDSDDDTNDKNVENSLNAIETPIDLINESISEGRLMGAKTTKMANFMDLTSSDDESLEHGNEVQPQQDVTSSSNPRV